MATICLHHVVSSMQGICARGWEERPLLERAGINPSILKLPGQRIHSDQVARLYALIQQQLDDEFMGFTSQPCRHGLFSLMCDATRHCGTLRTFLQQAAKFYNLVTPDVRFELETGAEKTAFILEMKAPHLDPRNFLTEFLLVIWHRFPSWYIGEPIQLIETHFNFSEPKHLSELTIMFPGKLKFGESLNRLVFSSTYLDKILMRNAGELEDYLTNAPADIMTIPGNQSTLDVQIESMLMSRYPQRLVFPSIESVAAEMGVSVQTLHRRLKTIGTHYQKIKDDLRREFAIRKLVGERLSVERVSDLVGYRESRSFTRAFKHWTGLSPRQYLKRNS